MTRKLLNTVFIFSALFCSCGLYAQTIKTVENVKGKAYLEPNVTPNEAKRQALQQAKTNALRKAGVAEYVNTWKTQITEQTGESVSRSFSEAINSEIRGSVKNYNTIETKSYKNEVGTFVFEVVINAEIIKYESKNDPNFNIQLNNIQEVYYEGANITFEVKPSKDCYLTIFNIAKSEDKLFYPNAYEDSKFLKANEVYQFPFGPINYKSMLPEGMNKEANTFIFVFTKNEPMGFVHTEKNSNISDHEKIWQEIHEIPPKDRKVKVRQFKIFAKK